MFFALFNELAVLYSLGRIPLFGFGRADLITIMNDSRLNDWFPFFELSGSVE